MPEVQEQEIGADPLSLPGKDLEKELTPSIIGEEAAVFFPEELVWPHVMYPNLESAYAEMARDTNREGEALEWTEITFKDLTLETASVPEYFLKKICARSKRPSRFNWIYIRNDGLS